MLSIEIALLAALGLANAQSRFTPSGNYTPTYGECPTDYTFVRPASDGLNTREKEWRTARNWQVKYALGDYLRNIEIDGFDVEGYIDALHEEPEKVPVIALSFSGGGTRAQLCELGLYQGLDARHQPSLEAKTGGLLQATTYIAGRQHIHFTYSQGQRR
jgi:lysophospholipase